MTADEFKDIIAAVSAVGFPIVMAILLWWQNVRMTTEYSDNLIQMVKDAYDELLKHSERSETTEGGESNVNGG